MKRIIKNMLMPVVAMVALTMGACNDWTDTENVGIHQPTLENQNPALYKAYLTALRDYKARNHKIVFLTIQNVQTVPSQRNEHLTNMPDSVDFISLANPDNLHPTLVAEMTQVREKGTRVVYNISFDEIEVLWKQKLQAEAASKPTSVATRADGDTPTQPADSTVEQRFITFCKWQVAKRLTYCDTYNYDGIEITYTGRAYASLKDEALTNYTNRQQTFLTDIAAWKEKHADKLLFFQGMPQNLIDKTLLNSCNYLILPALTAISADRLTYLVDMALVEGVPTDRILMGVTIPSLVDASNTNGYFVGYEADGKTRLRATKGVAQWVINDSNGMTKCGMAIADAQNDYYNISLVYKNIREAVNIMNPTVKN